VVDVLIDDPDMWLRRTAILSQNRSRDATDALRLFDYCLRRAHEREFFIRKAIGWALRDYAKTNPDAVRRFLDEHRSELSPLSIREASKHL
jgi:3-methyladenine DNA glycosylase AlkD